MNINLTSETIFAKITNGEKFQIFKTGIASATGFIERSENLTSIDKGGEALGFQIYEY